MSCFCHSLSILTNLGDIDISVSLTNLPEFCLKSIDFPIIPCMRPVNHQWTAFSQDTRPEKSHNFSIKRFFNHITLRQSIGEESRRPHPGSFLISHAQCLVLEATFDFMWITNPSACNLREDNRLEILHKSEPRKSNRNLVKLSRRIVGRCFFPFRGFLSRVHTQVRTETLSDLLQIESVQKWQQANSSLKHRTPACLWRDNLGSKSGACQEELNSVRSTLDDTIPWNKHWFS